jgi:hypothetical protein
LEKPASPVLTPHWMKPLSLTASKIAPASAVPEAAIASADAATKDVAKRMNGPPW